MSQHDAVTIRCWQLTGETALEDMVLGVDERAVRDGVNVLSSDDFDACLAIVVCRIGPNFYAHLSQVAGHYKGDASGIWDRSRGSGAPEGTTTVLLIEMSDANPVHESTTYQGRHSHPALA